MGEHALADGYHGENKELFLEPPVPMLRPPILAPDGQHLLFTTKKAKKLGRNMESKLMLMILMAATCGNCLSFRRSHIISDGKWSPDGKQIAYGVNRSSAATHQAGMFVMATEGLNSFQIAPDLKDHIGGYNWFPDSKRLVLSIR